MKALVNKLVKSIVIALFLLTHVSAFAIQETIEEENVGYDLDDDLSVVSSRHPAITGDLAGWFNDFGIAEVKNKITFGIDPDIHLIDDSYRYKIVFDLSWVEVVGVGLSTGTMSGIELELDFAPDGTYQDKQVYSFLGGIKMDLSNIQLYKWDGFAYVSTTIDRENLFLRGTIETEYYNDFDFSLAPTSSISLSISGTDLLVSFPSILDAEQYDLEWTWVNAYDGTTTGGIPNLLAATLINYDFRTNASRVRISENNYRIPLIYGDGYILVRYRPVGRVVENLEVDIDGRWMTFGTSYGDHNTVDQYAASAKMAVSALESNQMNYGASLTFVENGKKNTQLNFVDGLMKSRQQMSQINSQDELLVGSTIYDYYGRPAIGVMGSPVDESNLGYIEELNMFDATTPYDKAIFHSDELMLGECGPKAARPMDSDASNGSAHYYSASNTNKDGAEAFVPESDGYNFTQVHYTADPTGRAKRIGSVGTDHQLDASEGHYTEVILTAQDDPNEVDRLLGSEAADFVNYSKIISRDVHGQISVAIQDNFGRTVISYLEGSAPVGLEAIEGNGPETSIEVELTGFTSSETALDEAGILLVEQKIAVADPNQIYTFNYDFEALSFTDCLPEGMCFDCIYEIEFEVFPAEGVFTEECPLSDGTEDIGSSWSYTVGSITEFNTECETPLVFSDLHDETFTLKFPRFGEYYVRKTLKVSSAPMEYYWEQYVENADESCLVPYSNFLADALLEIDYSDCYSGSPCMLNFLYEYGTWEEYALETEETDESVYEALKEEFIKDCENQPICAQMRPILLGDVSPGGQYGDISGASGLSVFNDSDPMAYSWRDVTFLNDDGTAATTTNVSGEVVAVNHASISLAEFVTLWNPNWAEELLGAHPEYETYRFCELYPAVFDYMLDFKTTETYAEAVTAGFITPVNPSLYPTSFGGSPEPYTSGDPLINLINSLSGIKSALQTSLYLYDNSYIIPTNNYYDATQYMLNETGGVSFYDMASAMSDGTAFGSSTCDLDAQWEAFKTLYLARRNIILQIAMEGRAVSIAGLSYIRCIDYDISPFCTGSPYLGKLKRFLLFDQVMPYPFIEIISSPGLIDDMAEDAEAETIDFCETACASMADEWMSELEYCATAMLPFGETWDPGQTTYELIKADLVSVCQGGCTTEWPFPSQFDADGVGYLVSFEKVIEHYLGGSETIECNHYLIDYPVPVQDLSLVQTLSSCGCDKLLSVETEEEFEEEFGFVPANFCMDRETCGEIAGVSTASTYPEGSLAWNVSELMLLAEEITATDYACPEDGCIDCNELSTAITAFLTDFPTASIEEDATMFASYVNEMYGTAFDYYSLITFKDRCDSIAAGGIITEGFNPVATQFVDFLNVLIDGGGLYLNQSRPHTDFPLILENPYLTCPLGPYGDTIQYTTNMPFGAVQFTLVDQSSSCGPMCTQSLFKITPESLGGYASITDVINNLISFESMYATPADILAFDNRFHIVGLVNNPTLGGDPIEINFEFISGCVQAFAEELDILCSNFVPESEDGCVDALIATAEMDAEFAYGEYLATMKEKFMADYIETCKLVEETYNYNYQANRYHYTLFFYDVVGNLVKTVSPKGIVPLSNSEIADVKADRAGAGGAPHIPNHTFVTNYVYNGLNQPISLTTPDGGTTKFWYDNIGRMVVSQNARQAELTENVILGNPLGSGTSTPAYSYTRFDELGRPTEFGEYAQPTAMTNTISKNPTALFNWLFADATVGEPRYRNHVTRIGYSASTTPGALAALGGDQGDVRNRISGVSTVSDYVYMSPSWSFPPPDYINHYAYDVHGNVTDFVQELPDLTADGRQYLKTTYEFDLLSGIPNFVHFQQGEEDQFSHHFIYDADNRLKEVYTSKDGHIWDRDAEYLYRLDGKRARTELGDVQVQGMDYAYTLHGWLKALNSGILSPEQDMGGDGLNFGAGSSAGPNSVVAKDALAFTMGYYDGDYASIDTDPSSNFLPTVMGTDFHTNQNQLFNGNISSVTTAMMDLDENPLEVTGTTYRYDQLHRFKESHVFSSNDITELNSFVNAARQNLTVGTYNTLGDYEVHVDYDQNGNIDKLDRRAKDEGFGSNKMDEFSYNYPTTDNRLRDVQDAISGTSYGDIQNAQLSDNYKYHSDGSLMKDQQEEIAYIEWYPSGKIKRIYRIEESLKPDLYFEYDPMGGRSLKVEMTKDGLGDLLPEAQWNKTWYALDANGQNLAIYQKKSDNPALFRSEASIFGSSRIGLDTRRVEIVDVEEEDVYSLDDFMLGNLCGAAGGWFMNEVPGTYYNLTDVNADTETDLTVGHTTSTSFSAYLTINTDIGETYTVNYDMLAQTVPQVQARARECEGSTLGGTLSTGPGSYSYSFVATTVKSKLQWKGQASTGSFTLSNVEIDGPGDIFADIPGEPIAASRQYRLLGEKMYELSDHLGNVKEVISDRKLAVIEGHEYSLTEDFTVETSTCGTEGAWFLYPVGTTTYSLIDVDMDGNGDLTVSHVSSTNFQAHQTLATVIGETYTVSYDIIAMSIPFVKARAQRCSGGGNLGLLDATSTGSYSYTFVAATTKTKIFWAGQGSPGGSFTLGNITITGAGDIYGDFSSEETIVAYVPDVVSYSDYYPYGMEMPNRHGSIADYRYAFNGMEVDDEVSGDGNSYTTMFRQYDPRLGRWKSLDPMASKYPEASPFSAYNNNPVYFVDPLGLEGQIYDGHDDPDKFDDENSAADHLDFLSSRNNPPDEYFYMIGDFKYKAVRSQGQWKIFEHRNDTWEDTGKTHDSGVNNSQANSDSSNNEDVVKGENSVVIDPMHFDSKNALKYEVIQFSPVEATSYDEDDDEIGYVEFSPVVYVNKVKLDNGTVIPQMKFNVQKVNSGQLDGGAQVTVLNSNINSDGSGTYIVQVDWVLFGSDSQINSGFNFGAEVGFIGKVVEPKISVGYSRSTTYNINGESAVISQVFQISFDSAGNLTYIVINSSSSSTFSEGELKVE